MFYGEENQKLREQLLLPLVVFVPLTHASSAFQIINKCFKQQEEKLPFAGKAKTIWTSRNYRGMLKVQAK